MSTLYTRRAVIVVKATDTPAANIWMKANFDLSSGENSLTVPLYDEDKNLTYYWCSTVCTEDQFQALLAHFGSSCNDGNEIASGDVLATNGVFVSDTVLGG